jgi:hypothetical protein
VVGERRSTIDRRSGMDRRSSAALAPALNDALDDEAAS